MRLAFDKFRCARCGQCSGACPIHLIQQESLNHYPVAVADADERCINCNHCVSVCPVQAVSLAELTGVDCQPIEREMVPRFDNVATLIQTRRSIRRYAETPVENVVIEQLLSIARWAPSAKNGLPVQWIVVNDRSKVKELEKLTIDWFGTLKGMGSMVEAWKAGQDPIFRGAPCVIAAYTTQSAIWPVIDATIAVETLDLCIAARRLGSCWAGYFIQAAQKDAAIKNWLGLTAEETLQGALMVGHIGDENYQRIPPRPMPPIRWIGEEK